MRLLVTAEAATSGESRDAIVAYSAASTVGDLESLLQQLFGHRPVHADVADVIDLDARREGGSARTGPGLYLGSRRLDPEATLATAGIRHGAVVGLGGPSRHRAQEPQGLVEVRVSSGQGAGRVHRLGIGTWTIGSAEHCAIRVAGAPEIAARLEVDAHGAVEVTADESARELTVPVPARREPPNEPIVLAASVATRQRRRWRRKRPGLSALQQGRQVDPGAPLPLVRLDREPVTAPVTWNAGAVLGVANVLFELGTVSAPDASLSPSATGPELDYNRPPRLHPPARTSEFSLPSEPKRPDKSPIPVIMMLSPMVMSGFMYWRTGSIFSLMFMILMPIMMLLNATGTRRQQKVRYQEQLAEFHRRRADVEKAAVQSLTSERGQRRSIYPDPASVLLFATGPRSRLWERRRWDPDFLELRLGTSDLPSDVIVKDSTREQHEGPLRWTAPDVPVVVPLAPTAVLGICGPQDECLTTTSWLVAQVASLHSPTDASLWVFTDRTNATAWEWTKWLPHARTSEDHPRAARLAIDEDDRASMISELSAIVERRKELDTDERESLPSIVVVLDGARELRMAPGMTSLLKMGAFVHVYFICLDRTARELPEECRAVVELHGELLDLETTAERHIDGVRRDIVDLAWLERLGRALSPIRDVSTEDLSSSLPAASRLLDVLGLDSPTGQDLVRVWSGGGRTTKAVIGEGLDGPFRIDVRADGPHGLIAGTTGSGKSELLQTIIASLAVGNRPDEFNFVLIDYKGGAAFMDCQHLPHTVGMVTDLDGHLTTRALESLGAELRRREHQLADAQAKDIEDYLAARQPGDEPMPRLLIIIDEFAALVAELPDFVTGLVDVARRGRSLGVHLILATQRPAGVVNAEIKSNTNLRLALRVTDANDSDDVIESKVAAEIPKSFPGRAYARLGHSSLTPFQSSRVGGRPVGDERAELRSRGFGIDELVAPPKTAGDGEEDVSIPTDLATLVGAVREANDLIGLEPMRKPWLPPLPETLTLDDLEVEPAPAVGEQADIPPIVFGRGDLPHLQQQEVASWDLQRAGHLVIAGQSRSGRSWSLRTIAAAIARQTAPSDVHIFGIDAGNNALLPLMSLPHVGAVVTRTQTDRIFRLFAHLGQELTKRQQALAEQGFADIAEQRAAVEGPDRMPYLVVLLDRLEGFTTAFESVDGGVLLERLVGLLQEGVGAGIRIVIGADRSGILGRYSLLVDDRIVLSMSDPSDFSVVGLPTKQVPAHIPPGRGFRAGERPQEVQFAMIDASGEGTAQVRAIHELGRQVSERYGDLPRGLRPHRIDELPVAVSLDEALGFEPSDAALSPSFIPIGVGGDTLSLEGFDPLVTGPGFLVAGPPRSGRSSALLIPVNEHLNHRRDVLVIAPRRSPLRDLDDRRLQLFTGSEPIDEIREALSRLRTQHLVVVDDFEVVGADSPLGQLLGETYGAMRDTPNAMIIAGGIDELGAVYRGLPADLKRGRTGLVLSPRASNDGDVLNARLPRSVGAAVPPGRGLLINPTGYRWIQVPKA
ncbi:FtsK/SpoIIIE domain-containing protein [Aeromicrobium duanguangcaii]|uniref:FtsK/SpoIIIE domain-containing protein n=1 Tax=Aeromicrobium duanguangcaii TaxID=2968086 RepID=A0ABY5KCW0_9ACTN|nr:FtsK/SpoIIIE domain-containing protein [Aeromicrobium duanguangcaii]MCD9154987.1 cell division protein FtsK [Aeromicrobium duanguangcaii]UUI67608.1 FtsK/SpoIIIE domain-containing protein [Aeromicrobium duanguangcaii]